jgi:predicted TIM-barrel fold metal-dependent hydrolase
VSLLAGTYSRIWNAYKEILGEILNEKEQQQVFYSNAKEFYSL